jgi:hypothetical protein
MLKEGGETTERRTAWAFRLVTGRSASDREVSLLVDLFEEQRAEFAGDPRAAEKLLRVGASRPDAALDRAHLAAAATVALAILNHDGAAYRR